MSSATIDVERAPEHVALPAAPGPAEPEPRVLSHAAFVRWLIGSTLVAILVVAGVNWYVDPTGVSGRVTRWRIGENAEVRSGKIDRYEQLLRRGERPEVVLLGSSRAMKLDPAHVEQLTGAAAFNAAVSGGVPRDAQLFVRLLEERQADAFPHLVWALDVDAFREKQLRAGLSTDPRMQRFLPRSERAATALARAGALTELQTLKATVRSLLAGGSGAGADDGDAKRRFSELGYQQWSLPFPRDERLLDAAVRRQVAQYAGYIFERDAYTEVEQEPLAEFVDVIRTANEHGDVPTVFLTPYHPLAERLLERYELDEREQEARTALRELQRSGRARFELVDLSDLATFGGDPAQFYDGVHMTRANTRRVLARLHREGLLAPTRRG